MQQTLKRCTKYTISTVTQFKIVCSRNSDYKLSIATTVNKMQMPRSCYNCTSGNRKVKQSMMNLCTSSKISHV